MTITFDVNDDKAIKFLAAAKWKLGITNNNSDTKALKAYMATLIDEHKKFVAIGTLEAEVNNLQTQVQGLDRQLQSDRDNLRETIRNYDLNNVPTDPKCVK